MADFADFYEAEQTVATILQKDFIGPVKEDEVLTEFPTQYYIMGKLYPQNNHSEDADAATTPFLDNTAETYDSSISLSNQKNPSSMGVTFTVLSGVSEIRVTGSYAFYDAIPFVTARDSGISLPEFPEDAKKPEYVWQRNPYHFEHQISFSEDAAVQEIVLGRGIKLRAYTNRIFSDTGERVVTLVLINENYAESDLSSTNIAAIFQPEICITGVHGESIFTSVDRKVNLTTDQELLELDMLYQDVFCYAQGHGCSVIWDLDSSAPLWVKSSFFPFYKLKQMKPTGSSLKVFNMKRLYTESANVIVPELREFMKQYLDWIDELVLQSDTFNAIRKQSAERNIEKCRAAYRTISKTIDMLEADATRHGPAFHAFQLANEAMYLQRERALIRNGRSVDSASINWYPFQLAFLLQEMFSFIVPTSPEREKVDLLWFPTGGGKTEAYLGIAAFAIFFRRLIDPSDDGVTVIMRYTLRLLTLQQFERASMMIFACEKLRRERHLGGTEISIGLWVGGKLTPNELSKASSGINKLQNGGILSGEDENPCQIRVCPWCGQPITPQDYKVDMVKKRMHIRCQNRDCYYHGMPDGLPMHIIDQALYAHLPTFVIATVDKFAQITPSDKPAALFGITTHKNPPSLIIQDELHLISGPLGTMTGIYEAAITRLTEKDGICAKVIASTATIRNAANQIRALYGRGFTQFPPQGVSAKDSFFARESTEDERPARRYYGVMGTGITATTTMIRVYAALLFATRYLEASGASEKIVDAFWTITGYFNSLRELGGASTQILDDVQSRFGYLAKTKFAGLYPGVDPNHAYDNNVELTSRMNNEEITKVIQTGLNRSYPSPDVYDFVLASNMISVGVDIGRLGVMVVSGQPKTNAEYIQATSRVGRENPGIVFTIYNASRSRDRSHYEQFLKYHSALYRYVEATSLTPFSDRARDRGLHALFIALCRYLIPGLLGDHDAKNFSASDPQVRKIRQMILDYVSVVDPPELEAVASELDDICEKWEDQTIGSLSYKWGDKNLLKPDTDEDRFRTMNSMRNVDGQPGIYLLGRT